MLETQKKSKCACKIHLDRDDHDEMDLDYSLIEEKINELNEMGVDITLQEVGDIIESKFVGKPTSADVQRWKEGANKGRLVHPQYTLIRHKDKKEEDV